MDNGLQKKPDMNFQELTAHVEEALREAGRRARKRAEETGVPLVMRENAGDMASSRCLTDTTIKSLP